MYITGEFPPDEIDHIDLNRSRNVWSNLRPALGTQNKANLRARANNRLGIKGVRQMPNGRFAARIKVDGNERHIGTFPTIEAAEAAYAAAAIEAWGPYARTGEGAR
jgi:hypothetical protein